MNELKIFENEEFGQLSVIVKNNKEYIEAIEVATMLGYSNPRDAINRHCNLSPQRDVHIVRQFFCKYLCAQYTFLIYMYSVQ